MYYKKQYLAPKQEIPPGSLAAALPGTSQRTMNFMIISLEKHGDIWGLSYCNWRLSFTKKIEKIEQL